MKRTFGNAFAVSRLFGAGRAGSLAIGLLTAGWLLGCGSSNNSKLPGSYVRSDLTADQASAGAAHVDPSLINAWGLSSGPQTYFWVANEGSGTATVYDGTGAPMPAPPLVVTIPPAGGGTVANPTAQALSAGLGSPTGLVFNGSTDFMGDNFIFATLDGTISGWASGSGATLRWDNSASGASYTGLAIGNNGSGLAVGSNSPINYLYAANFAAGTVDVLDGTYTPVNLGAGAFVDPTLPAGYSPFGIQSLGSTVYVAYAQRTAPSKVGTAGAGRGYVSAFATNGTFSRRLVSQGSLDAPWGLTMAPAGFAGSAQVLLVGNFGDGHIGAYEPSSGRLLGQLKDASGTAIAIDGLWGLVFGNGASGGNANTLYFTAGPQGEVHGLFGAITLGGPAAISGGDGGY